MASCLLRVFKLKFLEIFDDVPLRADESFMEVLATFGHGRVLASWSLQSCSTLKPGMLSGDSS